MKKQYFINANIIDPQNSINENGGLIVGEEGKIEAIGKKVNTNNLPSREKPIDLKGKYIFPGLVDISTKPGNIYFPFKSIGFSLEGKLFVFTFFPIASILPSSPTISPPFSLIEF